VLEFTVFLCTLCKEWKAVAFLSCVCCNIFWQFIMKLVHNMKHCDVRAVQFHVLLYMCVLCKDW